MCQKVKVSVYFSGGVAADRLHRTHGVKEAQDENVETHAAHRCGGVSGKVQPLCLSTTAAAVCPA